MKRLVLVIPVFFMLFAFSSITQAKSKEVYEVKPAKDTEEVFSEVTLTVEGDNAEVSIKNKIEGDISESYHVVIDKEKKTYKVDKSKVESVVVETQSPTLAALAGGDKYLYVTGITDDPPGEDLAKTQAKLWWSYTGSSTSKLATEKSCWANSYSNLATTWYTDSCSVTSNASIDSGRTQTYGVSGYYHNYDWGYDSQITKTNHNVYLEGYSDGSSWYNVTWGKSGESSSLLDLDIVVSKGNL